MRDYYREMENAKLRLKAAGWLEISDSTIRFGTLFMKDGQEFLLNINTLDNIPH